MIKKNQKQKRVEKALEKKIKFVYLVTTHIYIYLPTPLYKQDVTQGLFLKGV